MRQDELTRNLNFDFYLLSSIRETEIFSPYAEYLEPEVFRQMVDSATILYGLVDRILKQFLADPSDHSGLQIPDFPLRKKILGLKSELIPFFWVRYDAFERASGGIFFSEFNYDKPCAQRETAVSEAMNPEGNPSLGFADRFRQGVSSLWARYGIDSGTPRVGILVDPNHYEETHLAFLYSSLIKPLGYQCLVAGGQNLRISGDRLHAFGQPIDLLIRQYPGEFCHEVNNYRGLLNLIDRGRLLMLNDPRSIIPQAKSWFAYLWDLMKYNPGYLSPAESEAIRQTVPYSRIFTPADREQVLGERESWVIKSVFGRYSESVYIGAMVDDKDWQEIISFVIDSKQPHIMQEFVPIKKRLVRRFNGQEYADVIGFGNHGVYFTCGSYAGICARWSDDYLNVDDEAWFSPIGVRPSCEPLLALETHGLDNSERNARWLNLSERLAFDYGYTNSYTGDYQSFLLEPLRISPVLFTELVQASEGLARLFNKTRRFVQEHYTLFESLLGIPKALAGMVQKDQSPWLTFLGRLDWALDREGNLRLLELNTDTPAGLESIGLNAILQEQKPGLSDPNLSLADRLRSKFKEMTAGRPVKTLGLVASAGCEEDWSNLRQMGTILEPLVQRLIWGDISALSCRHGKVSLYDQELDALYRYYPLDWLGKDQYYRRLIPALEDLTLINPPSSILAQSKAFLALVWQMLKEQFYDDKEQCLIKKYLVPTYLKWTGNQSIIKPYLEREGQGIMLSRDLQPGDLKILARKNVVYQDLVEIDPLLVKLYSSYDSNDKVAYPILGAFLVGDEFSGLYTRLGPQITNRYALVAPTFY